MRRSSRRRVIAVNVYEPVEQVRETVRKRVAEGLHAVGGDPKAADLISLSADLPSTVARATYVTEAVPEKLTLKREMFAQLVNHAPRAAILASNSSVIPDDADRGRTRYHGRVSSAHIGGIPRR